MGTLSPAFDPTLTYPNFRAASGGSGTLAGKRSRALAHMFDVSAAGCLEYTDERSRFSCFTLAHACVLRLYDQGDAVCRRRLLFPVVNGRSLLAVAPVCAVLPIVPADCHRTWRLAAAVLRRVFAFFFFPRAKAPDLLRTHSLGVPRPPIQAKTRRRGCWGTRRCPRGIPSTSRREKTPATRCSFC